MGKLLSWVVMGIVGYLVWRLVRVIARKSEAARTQAGGASEGARAGPAGGALTDERIVPCAHCGVHVPASEAVEADGRHYCSVEHRDAARNA